MSLITKRSLSVHVTLAVTLLGSIILYWNFIYKPDGNRPLTSYANQVNLDDKLITIVTAYFDIGRFQKGEKQRYFDPKTYTNFARTFQYLLNPLVVYTDSEEFTYLMTRLRKGLGNRTKIFQIDRNSSWAFQLKHEIAKVFSQPSYPKFHPNTVLPEYDCAQFAKYDVTARAVRQNYFRTKHFAWLDVGYFRDFLSSSEPFILGLPCAFNESRIAYSRVYRTSFELRPDEIFKDNKVMACGCLFLGTSDVITAFEKKFRTAVNYFIKQGLMNTDQQMIFAMYSVEGRKAIPPEIELQLYHRPGSHADWFYLGKQMRRIRCGNDTSKFCGESRCSYTNTGPNVTRV